MYKKRGIGFEILFINYQVDADAMLNPKSYEIDPFSAVIERSDETELVFPPDGRCGIQFLMGVR